MLAKRAASWQFDWIVWEWRDSRLEVLASDRGGGSKTRDPGVCIDAIALPPTTRNPPPGFEALRTMARERGVVELFDYIVSESLRLGASIKNYSTGVTMDWNGASEVTVALDRSSSEAGLVLGCSEAVEKGLNRDTFRPVEFSRFNWQFVSIRTIDDVAYLMKVVHTARTRP